MLDGETSTTTEVTETPTGTTEAPASDAADTSTILGGDAKEDASPEADKPEGGDPSAAAEPVVPEAYDLSAPEGFTLDPALMEAITPDLKGAKLTNEQAQAILPAAVKFAESLKTAGEQKLLASVMSERAAWAAESKADADIGGAKWDETVSLSAKALDALPESVGKPLRALLNDSGLGNKREMIAAMAFYGRSIGEDSVISADARPGSNVPLAHQMYPNDVPKGG